MTAYTDWQLHDWARYFHFLIGLALCHMVKGVTERKNPMLPSIIPEFYCFRFSKSCSYIYIIIYKIMLTGNSSINLYVLVVFTWERGTRLLHLPVAQPCNIWHQFCIFGMSICTAMYIYPSGRVTSRCILLYKNIGLFQLSAFLHQEDCIGIN